MKRILFAALLFLAQLAVPHAGHAQCPNPKIYASPASVTTSGSTQLVAAPGLDPDTSTHLLAIHICAVTIQVVQGTTASNFGLIAGTGSACAVSTSLITPAFLGSASAVQSFGQAYTNAPIVLPVGTALCLNLSAAPTGAVVHVQYSIY